MTPHWGLPSCGTLQLSEQLQLSVVLSFACMASNSILIVYVALAATRSKVTVIPSLLPSSFLLLAFLFFLLSLSTRHCCFSPGLSSSFSVFFSLSWFLLFIYLFKGLDDGQARDSMGLCSTEGTVPRYAKVMLGTILQFMREVVCTKH